MLSSFLLKRHYRRKFQLEGLDGKQAITWWDASGQKCWVSSFRLQSVKDQSHSDGKMSQQTIKADRSVSLSHLASDFHLFFAKADFADWDATVPLKHQTDTSKYYTFGFSSLFIVKTLCWTKLKRFNEVAWDLRLGNDTIFALMAFDASHSQVLGWWHSYFRAFF